MTHLHNPEHAAMFRASCFVVYVNMSMWVEFHMLLCHYHMCKETTTYPHVDLEELLFPIGDYWVCFDKRAFCLTIGFQFRDYLRATSSLSRFKQCVFPFVLGSKSVKVADVIQVFNTSLHRLSEGDVIRVSLMYMLE